MNTQETKQFEVVKQRITPNSKPHRSNINADFVHSVVCGNVVLSEWISRYSQEKWRSIDWLDGKLWNSKSWVVTEEPTPFDQLAEELRNAI